MKDEAVNAIDSEHVYAQNIGMNTTKSLVDPELAIWERVFLPDALRITQEQARYLLDVRFSQSDLDRINELSEKAGAGTLKSEEEAELERYVHMGHLLSILKAKVRRRLRKAAS